ncbi:MAG TPA: penicillin-binding protein 2 [Gemmatimonadaceae bacterium]|nr:penicillin-binding protein 2 [Gemmatimonadaceae bacterium]
MSFHPNDIARRTRLSSVGIAIFFVVLLSAFFRTQVLQHEQFVQASLENRLREIPLPAPRGIIYDRKGKIIAENLPAYSVSITAPSLDSLRTSLRMLQPTLQLTDGDIAAAVRRYRRAPTRPTVILPDASIDVISVLEEHRLDYPRLIIQSVPKRFYPDGPLVASFVGYTGEITETELNLPQFAGYKPGQTIGKGGLEKQYEPELHGKEGQKFDEVDARGRPVRGVGPRPDKSPVGAPPLHTNIDLDLQKFMASVFGDSLRGGAIALEPRTGAVLALYSAPSFDPNRFTGGIPADYWKQLNTDPTRPLFNKVIQGTYPPASTWKLATAAIGLSNKVVTFNERMPVSCSGGMQYGRRYFRCWEKRGHGSQNLAGAIEKSCDVYFYQLGLRIGLSRLVGGGIDLEFNERSGIDLPNEYKPRFPLRDVRAYYDRRYGPRGWTAGANSLNLSIGQGENSQTVVNMAKFFTALATDGSSARPEIVKRNPERKKILNLTPQQMNQLRLALAGVVSERGTAGGARIQGLVIAGKTGTAQNSENPNVDHAWFVGFAPAENPTILVSVFLEFGDHGWLAARVASKIIGFYTKAVPVELTTTE